MVGPAADARTIQIDHQPLKERYVVWNFPMDLRITGSVAAALPLLRQTVETLQTAVQREQVDQGPSEVAAARRVWLRRRNRGGRRGHQPPLAPDARAA